MQILSRHVIVNPSILAMLRPPQSSPPGAGPPSSPAGRNSSSWTAPGRSRCPRAGSCRRTLLPPVAGGRARPRGGTIRRSNEELRSWPHLIEEVPEIVSCRGQVKIVVRSRIFLQMFTLRNGSGDQKTHLEDYDIPIHQLLQDVFQRLVGVLDPLKHVWLNLLPQD